MTCLELCLCENGAAAMLCAASLPGLAWGMLSSTLVSRTFKTTRHTTHFLECGPSPGPLMIFLHGWPELSLMWRAQMAAFAADGWRCVAPDMRGYGGSSAPDAANAYTNEQVVADMVNFTTTSAANPRSGSATTGAASSSERW